MLSSLMLYKNYDFSDEVAFYSGLNWCLSLVFLLLSVHTDDLSKQLPKYTLTPSFDFIIPSDTHSLLESLLSEK